MAGLPKSSKALLTFIIIVSIIIIRKEVNMEKNAEIAIDFDDVEGLRARVRRKTTYKKLAIRLGWPYQRLNQKLGGFTPLKPKE